MKSVPAHLLILGGGPVGAEMAQIVRSLGGDVTVVESASRLLPRKPRAAGRTLGRRCCAAAGPELALNAKAMAARRDGPDYVLTLSDGREVRGDRLLVATGRRPRPPGGLDTVGVTFGPRGIPVDFQAPGGRPAVGRR